MEEKEKVSVPNHKAWLAGRLHGFEAAFDLAKTHLNNNELRKRIQREVEACRDLIKAEAKERDSEHLEKIIESFLAWRAHSDENPSWTSVWNKIDEVIRERESS